MTRFQYKYSTVEDVKEKIKRNSEREYAISRKAADAKKIEIERLNKNYLDSFVELEKLTPQEIIFIEKYRESLLNNLEIKKIELADLENECKHKLEILVEHNKDYKVFEKLKEKHLEEFLKNQYKLEMKSIDEIANQKFYRREK